MSASSLSVEAAFDRGYMMPDVEGRTPELPSFCPECRAGFISTPRAHRHPLRWSVVGGELSSGVKDQKGKGTFLGELARSF